MFWLRLFLALPLITLARLPALGSACRSSRDHGFIASNILGRRGHLQAPPPYRIEDLLNGGIERVASDPASRHIVFPETERASSGRADWSLPTGHHLQNGLFGIDYSENKPLADFHRHVVHGNHVMLRHMSTMVRSSLFLSCLITGSTSRTPGTFDTGEPAYVNITPRSYSFRTRIERMTHAAI